MSGAPPLFEGRQPLVPGWSLELPFPMARRIEDGALVFWHSPRGLTFWLNAYGGEDPAEALRKWRAARSPDGFDLIEESDAMATRFAYRLDEAEDDDREPAFYGFAAAPGGGEIHIAGYFDDAGLLADVLATWRSVSFTPPG